MISREERVFSMSSSYGNRIKVQIFGQSHSTAIGVVMDGIPAGIEIDMDKLHGFMERRAPGRNIYSTQRREKDMPEILSGIVDNVTVGAPICAVIHNTDTRSKDYDNLRDMPRPGHADFPAYVKYQGANDIRGGGHFSGRLTAPLCFAGNICMQMLEKQGITIGAHIARIQDVMDKPFDPVSIGREELESIKEKEFPVLDDEKGALMRERIESARMSMDSVGGTIECAVVGLPAGIGEPIFDGIENNIAKVTFGIPAVKGIEFGAGFMVSEMKGSENNDEFYYDYEGTIKTYTNNHGGILGGISSGMPIIYRVAIKPTSSIAQKQRSISLSRKENTILEIKGRHDPCIVPRAVPVVEAACAIALLDLLIYERAE